jgi:hypothetical protein
LQKPRLSRDRRSRHGWFELTLEARLCALGPRVRELADEHLVGLYFEYLDCVEAKFAVEAIAMYLPPNPADARVAALAAVLLPEADGLDEYFVARLQNLAGC